MDDEGSGGDNRNALPPDEEEMLCGALIASPGEYGSVARWLRPEHFARTEMGALFEAIGSAGIGVERVAFDVLAERLDPRAMTAFGTPWLRRFVENAVNGWPVDTAARSIAARAAERRANDSAAGAVKALEKGDVRTARIYAADVAKQIDSDEPWREPTALDAVAVPAFPLHILPPAIRMFVEELSCATQAATDLAAFCALGVLSAALRGRFRVRCGNSHIEGINLYLAVALNTGERKSPVFGRACRPLWETQDAMNAKRAVEREDGDKRSADLKSRCKKLQARLDRAPEDDEARAELAAAQASLSTLPKVPPALRLFVDDATPEALEVALRESEERMAVLSAEGGDLFTMMAGGYGDVARLKVYLSSYSWEYTGTSRLSREWFVLRKPCLTICTTTQPSTLATLAKRAELRDRGLPARFLFALPASLVGTREVDPPGMSRLARETWHECVRKILEWPDPLDDNGARLPVDITMTEDAKHALHEFQRHVEPRLADPNDLGALHGWGHKLVGNAMRLCGLLHLVWLADRPDPWEFLISAEQIEDVRAFALDYAVPHARAAFAVMNDSPGVVWAKKLLDQLAAKRQTRVTRRDVHRLLNARGDYDVAANPAISVLEAHGYLRPTRDLTEPLPPSLFRRKPVSERWAVNPMWLSTLAPKAKQ